MRWPSHPGRLIQDQATGTQWIRLELHRNEVDAANTRADAAEVHREQLEIDLNREREMNRPYAVLHPIPRDEHGTPAHACAFIRHKRSRSVRSLAGVGHHELVGDLARTQTKAYQKAWKDDLVALHSAP